MTGPSGFTLIELLASMVVIVLILLLLTSITNSTGRTWSATNGKIEAFREAREAFEAITRRLSQATLNTYWDYNYPPDANGDPDTSKAPLNYTRQSELRFIAGQSATLLSTSNALTHAVFFQAPLGYVSDTTKYSKLENLLNTWGYFIQFGDDASSRPPFLDTMNPPLAKRYRFRVMELMEPADSLTLYGGPPGTTGKGTSGHPSYAGHDWFTFPLGESPRPVRALAENIVAMVILPRLTSQEDSTGALLCPNYSYDSTRTNDAGDMTVSGSINWRNQLPPVVGVTMVAVDESSFSRIQGASAAMPDFGLSNLFQKVGSLSSPSVPGYAHDLQALQQTLQARHLGYRVFSADVSIRSAKWSRNQSN